MSRDVWSRERVLSVVNVGEALLWVLSSVCLFAASGLCLLAAHLTQEEGD